MRETRESKSHERKAAFLFGTVFVAIFLVVALFLPKPSPFQYSFFRIILALAAAGVAAFIPGFINVSVKGSVRAGGALAVFVIVYFFNPAKLISEAEGGQRTTIEIQQTGSIEQASQSGGNTAGVQGNVSN